ncbi:tether containing UBX domain for GLUT4 [Bombyx mandarina]|uniref:Tether containing UBX domain for GLUT4 n=1 Tax=Bombyx mandarina TaxID=7092 RepID=A0A6J2JQ34_BOMMA|nr:tether containing UBX domain for GLUT4 [Bombyx mandarina]
MSKDIIILTPNGRRHKVHCTPDTSMLQILEDACQKQGFQPSDYNLKFHNQIMDLTTTIRFSNVPNRATLEMVECETRREESIVTIGLMLEDGERRTADFNPNIALYDMIMKLAPNEFGSLLNPCILYMRQEVVGVDALKLKSLRHLGLIKGKAILRLLNKLEDARQANVSAVYRCPISENKNSENKNKGSDIQLEKNTPDESISLPGPSVPINFLSEPTAKTLKIVKEQQQHIAEVSKTERNNLDKNVVNDEIQQETQNMLEIDSDRRNISSSLSQEFLERRLKIEEEVNFLGTQKAIVFTQPEIIENDLEDLPDDFYELTIEEVRKLYKDLQQQRLKLENTPLMTSTKREEVEKETSETVKLNKYKNAVVRIQFPDHMILQGIFAPTDTIEDVTNFLKEHLAHPEKPFHIFTTPLKETLEPKMTLLEARFVPCVHMHFKWLEESPDSLYLKKEIYSNTTTSDAASILASKYRAPSRRKLEEIHNSHTNSPTTSKSSKVPKWFKN